MEYNDIGDNGMSSVADGLQHNKSLTKLNVSECEFSAKGSHNYIWHGISCTKGKLAAIIYSYIVTDFVIVQTLFYISDKLKTCAATKEQTNMQNFSAKN